MKRSLSALVATAAIVLSALFAAAPANAVHKDGVVDAGEFGLYYNFNYGFPVFDLFFSDSDFYPDVFPGTGIWADNNTRSFWNRDTYTWQACTGYSYTGTCGVATPGQYDNLASAFVDTLSSARFL
jgi:hypothetical protein